MSNAKSSQEFRMSLRNQTIFEFYQKHSYLDFEQVNLLCIQLFENILQDATSSMNKSISSQILSEISDNKSKIIELNNQLNLLHKTISSLNSDISLKFNDAKKDYVTEVKNIITIQNAEKNDKISSIIEKSNNSIIDKNNLIFNQSVDKISHLLEKSTSTLIDKTKLLLTQILPENQDKTNLIISDSIQKFNSSIISEINKISSNEKELDKLILQLTEKNNNKDKILSELSSFLEKNNSQELYQNFLSNFEIKFNNYVQSIQQPIITVLSQNEEKIQNNINSIHSQISQKNLSHDKIMSNFEEYLNKYRNSSYKGALCENRLRFLLTKMFPSAEVVDTSGTKESGDCLLRRDSKDTIIFETKEYDTNVNPDEVKKFIRDCTIQKSHGIFLSQISGITSKSNFQIDINNNKILVYIHYCEYLPEKIQAAIDIIDHLNSKFIIISNEEDDLNESIPKEILDEINSEYQKFYNHKQNLITTVKDFEKKINSQISDIKFTTLETYLSRKYANTQKTNICDICNTFTCDTLKGLAAHKRHCKKNSIANSTPTPVNIIIDNLNISQNES